MRGKKARLLRKLTYGERTIRAREYRLVKRQKDKNGKSVGPYVIADATRRTYQSIKRLSKGLRGTTLIRAAAASQ
jgi:excinuclease UvrABC nuclease subunit